MAKVGGIYNDVIFGLVRYNEYNQMKFPSANNASSERCTSVLAVISNHQENILPLVYMSVLIRVISQ
jgi:hypothetical protein